jgi:hypothetical protein
MPLLEQYVSHMMGAAFAELLAQLSAAGQFSVCYAHRAIRLSAADGFRFGRKDEQIAAPAALQGVLPVKFVLVSSGAQVRVI